MCMSAGVADTCGATVDVRCCMGGCACFHFSFYLFFVFFFFNDTATTEIYTLSLHDALPILMERKCGMRMKRLLVRVRTSRNNIYV